VVPYPPWYGPQKNRSDRSISKPGGGGLLPDPWALMIAPINFEIGRTDHPVSSGTPVEAHVVALE
ncbi:MAG: hypothetical protein WBC56_05725, partial [Methanoregula sp.]|uniref:hypothetical protein n=1 Tax=Methanoregula sp. TaxID=2052170 RepID=UPI003C70D137